MLHFTAEQLRLISLNMQQGREHEWTLKQLREAYGELLSSMDDDFLRQEIHANLTRCDELKLHSSQDRLCMCFLDIVGFPGFKSLPNLDNIIAQCRGQAEDPNHILFELQRGASSVFWLRVMEHCKAERQRRGMPI